jgi:hypothetical protein
MLSAFSPRAIVELKARDKSKIESILAYGRPFYASDSEQLHLTLY